MTGESAENSRVLRGRGRRKHIDGVQDEGGVEEEQEMHASDVVNVVVSAVPLANLPLSSSILKVRVIADDLDFLMFESPLINPGARSSDDSENLESYKYARMAARRGPIGGSLPCGANAGGCGSGDGA